MSAARPLTPEDAHWKRAAESAGDGVWDWAIDKDAIELSHGLSHIWEQVLGRPEDLRGAGIAVWASHVHPDDRPRVDAALRAHLANERASTNASTACANPTARRAGC